MAERADLRGRRGLLIDDMTEMRSAMRIQLSDLGLDQCDAARNVKEAVEHLTHNRYDLIVCDYNLGQGADGQQLLELVRRRQILPFTTAFLMVTGETGYEQVSTAAEYAPDDYLLKPFTAEMLGTRLERIFNKKAALANIHRAMGKGDRSAAITACDEVIAQQPRHALDALRLKGELLTASNLHAAAIALYEAVLARRSTPWAVVGVARAHLASGNVERARQLFEEALVAYPSYLAAYDALAGLLARTDKFAAQAIIEQALKVAPSTQRMRELGTLAIENRDFERAEHVFKRVVDKDRTGFFKSHDDYAGLARSCIEQGKTSEALAAVKDMGAAFARSPELLARQAAMECQAHAKNGNSEAAQAALNRALDIQRAGVLDAAAALDVAQACFAGGRADEARDIIRGVAEDHFENDSVLARAQAVFAAAGLHDEGTVFLEATRKRMIKLNNDAVALAKSGQLEQAVNMLVEAAERLPNNAQIALNAALALLMHVHHNGSNADYLKQVETYIAQAQRINPQHPKLAEVIRFRERLALARAAARVTPSALPAALPAG